MSRVSETFGRLWSKLRPAGRAERQERANKERRAAAARIHPVRRAVGPQEQFHTNRDFGAPF